jgi:AcrR family transcriptional regulator
MEQRVTTLRVENRRRLRAALVGAARALTVERGWESVRMADVAVAAGVSRQTLYNEFDSKAGLAEAMATVEMESFVASVREELFRHGADVRAAGRVTIHRVLVEAGDNPLVRTILTGERDGVGLLPYLTTDGGMVLSGAAAVVRDWAATFLPQVDLAVRERAADAIVRLTISHLMLDGASAEEVAERLADVLVRLLA